ncbi:TonB-linked SusC/RagA family outer membrane protein [Dyadobacter sp. BE34]|uniref:TonB-linked SusC/RagA family outer membrane protein n=1 Tax=Dyadobacter fermentans TaxID=94254 RepID=A0ABU1QRV5_9BACT|nr:MULTISPECIES: TonB-dependent receptor [Dyadobacter]MDR6803495.1 TonB-linked SusC/RagA family outer membrane protein [Dyadobacter fermentans]MDR7041236.1 TonB-linked SusC/RagA family outer membrane protein [Dyadobacter sp. BE242]MDR7195639.1 TonB-linked SusC/RagA family outer membrane protein [Dyadobacter sp. BE34]MDR7213816.1 TonB-linked SusC/RagA family outer membrane protein [Dyadobacter sp. BE31]MDR7261046.1 TonB-linked SusC/RagA family outer membrane protein [Dyadobacter sp. BE32]
MGKHYKEIIWQIMKISIVPCLLWMLCVQLSLAKDLRAQEILSQRISISVTEMDMEKVLEKIEGQTKVRFIYSAEVIHAERKVTLDYQNQRLDTVLEMLLGPLGIEYKVSKKTILLRKAAEKKTSLKTEPFENTIPRAQADRDITGKVLDEKGEPIPGASVVVKGTTVGTSTNIEGIYQLSVPEDKDIVIFSFVGYISQEIRIGNAANLDITLKVDEKALEEVVVVGFGEQKKVSVTGSVSSVTSEVLQQSSSASLANSLSGRLPGLTSIQSGGGQPGRDDATMYLRGAATTNGRSPLILIDGVPRDNIRTLDANEVASVSILKDASATAVFGVRGANGVILITTKRGTAGKNELTINAEQSFTSFTREPERLHSLEYMALRNEASKNDGITPLPFSEETMAKYANPLAGLDPNDPDYARKAMVRKYIYPDHDYYREYISRYAPQTRVNMNVTGGTDKVSYFVNGGYLHQGGNLNTEPKSVLGYDPAAKMDRYNFRANLDYKVTNSLKSFLNIGSYIEQVNMPAAWLYGNSDTGWMMSDLIYQAQTILPITPGPTTIEGFGVAPGQIVDPGYMDRSAFEIMNRMGARNEVRSNLNASFGAEWDLSNVITKGLSLKGMLSYDSKATTAMQGKKSERLYLAEVDMAKDQLSYAVKRSDESLLTLTKGADSRYNINVQGSINYARAFGKHDVTGMILGQRDTWESTAGEIPFNVLGVAGRATYGYDERYLAEVNMGYNGSEQFAPGHRYGFFPAFSAGWIISNENFLKNNRYITNLKLRASYGKVGNDKMGSARFLYQSNITLGGDGPLGSLGLGQTINQGLLGNPNITWEIAKKQNYGLDLQILRDLNLSVDVFKERRSNILITRGTVPEFQGVPLGNIPKVNMGLVDNKGFEIELSYNKAFSKDFKVMVSGNYGYNHNTVKFLDESVRDETYAYRYRSTGFSLNQSWGYKIDYGNGNGYFNSKEELDSYLKTTTYGFGEPRVGDFKYIDLNKDGVINDKDQAPIGYSNIPRVIYGLSLTFEYKGFDLTTFFQGVGKYSSNYSQQGVYEYIIRGTYFDYHKTAWTPERYAAGEKITYPALSTHSNTNHNANDFFVMNRSFTRLKNLVLGYTLPAGALKAVGVSKMRLYVSAQNYFTWAHLKMGHLDPENDASLGYPVTKMANFGLNITF